MVCDATLIRAKVRYASAQIGARCGTVQTPALVLGFGSLLHIPPPCPVLGVGPPVQPMMIGKPPIMLNPVCSICNRPVKLETSKTDERGQAVHEGCYLLKVKVKRTTTAPKRLLIRRSINTQKAV